MRFLLVIGLMVLIAACDTSRNTPDPEESFFVRFYGDDGNQEAVDMIVNDDGTMILLGTSVKTSTKPSQVYLVKVTTDGFVIWEKFFGDSFDWIAKDIELTATTGQYVIAAEKISSATDSDFLIFTLSDSGADAQIIDTGSFTYPGQSQEIPVSVTQIYDNGSGSGFIVTGSTNYDNGTDQGFEGLTAVFARFDQTCANYTGSWVEYAGLESDDYGIRVIQRADLSDTEPFVFFGYKNSPPVDDISNTSYNFWFSKMGAVGGNVVVSSILKDSPADMDEELQSVSAINSGSLANYILTGIISPLTTGEERIFVSVVKDAALFADGTLIPQTLPFDLGDLTLKAPKFKSTSSSALRDGGYIIAANTVVSGNSEMLLMKLNVDGSILWTNPVLLGGQGDDWQAMVHELPDRRILLFGTMQIGDDRQSKMALCKLNPYGRLE
jgi:hypothetical protein